MKNFFEKISQFYSKRKPRERVMLWLFIFALILFWSSSLLEKQREVSEKLSDLSAKENLYNAVIIRENAVSANLAEAKKF